MRILFIAAWVIASAISAKSAAQSATATPPRRAALGRAERRATIRWQRVPLQNALDRLKEVFEEPVFVDRRIDPTQRVSLEIDGATLGEVLQRLSAVVPVGYSKLEPLHYLGPPSVADQLRTVAAAREADVRRLAGNNRPVFELKRAVTWPRLAEPRQLISDLVVRHGWRIGRAERIPHDLWSAGKLPPMTLSEQLTLLLFGFDLTFAIKPAERTLEIVPLKEVTIRREYRLPSRSSTAIEPLRQVLAEAKSHRLESTKLIVDARVEQHERLAELLRSRSVVAPANRVARPAKQLYTLRVQDQPVGAVLNELAARVGWSIDVDSEAIRAAGLSLDRRVSFSVENNREDELLEAVLRPAGLDYLRDGERLQIVPRMAEVK